MEQSRIAQLLEPFLVDPVCHGAPPSSLADSQLSLISDYLDLLLRWNARINLTAIREPEEMITRHFGESLFAARKLFPPEQAKLPLMVIDVGSGAGFPGVPIKIFAPFIHQTLIEANNKKATFLRELVRNLKLGTVEVFANRADRYSGRGDLITLRAVENFKSALRTAISLTKPLARVALLIGESQFNESLKTMSQVAWNEPLRVPLSNSRILLVGESK